MSDTKEVSDTEKRIRHGISVRQDKDSKGNGYPTRNKCPTRNSLSVRHGENNSVTGKITRKYDNQNLEPSFYRKKEQRMYHRQSLPALQPSRLRCVAVAHLDSESANHLPDSKPRDHATHHVLVVAGWEVFFCL